MHPKIATAGADLLSVNARERAIRAPLVTLSLMRMLGLTTALASVVIVPVKAASADNPASTARAERKFTLNIPAQKLSSTLVALSNATGTQLAYGTELSDGLRSSAISGTMSVSAALTQILNGTGLTYRLSGNVVTLVKASANITLGPVRVGGMAAHQDPTGPGVGYVAENTMSGTKTDTPLMEIPNSIYVVTKQQMVDQQPQNVREALRYTPGVYAEGYGSASNGDPVDGATNIKQRGFGATQFVDGLQTNSFSAGETAFLDRIEVVNGPTSVMYGQLTPGGMIGVSLKKPTVNPLHQVSLGFGNWGRYESTLDLSDKITKSGNVRYRIAAIGVTQGSQTDYVNYRRVGALPSVTWDVNQNTSISLIGSYLYTPENGTNMAGLPAHGTLLPGVYGRLPRSRFLGDSDWNSIGSRDAMFEYLFEHKFSNYIKFSQTFRWEKSSYNYDTLGASGAVSDTIFSRDAQKTHYSTTTIGVDSRLSGNIKIGSVYQTWIAGFDFRKYTYDDNFIFDYTSSNYINVYNPTYDTYSPCFAYNANCKTFGIEGQFDRFQKGIYFQDQVKYQNLSIVIGGRQDWVNLEGYSTQINDMSGGKATSHTYPSSTSQAAFTWRAGADYKFNFGLAPYFSYATSFVPQSGSDWRGKPFAPLTGRQFEAGLKYKIPNKEVLLTASAFHINEDHYLVTDTVHTNFSADAGNVKSKGFEVSARANISKNIRIIANYSYTDIRYANSNLTGRLVNPSGYAPSRGIAVSQKGKYVQMVPRNMFSIFLDYTPSVKIMKGFGINGGIRYVGFTYSDAVNSYKVPSYFLFDIGARYNFGEVVSALEGLSAQLSISNLTNKYYVSGCATNSCYIGQGRRVYGNLTYNW